MHYLLPCTPQKHSPQSKVGQKIPCRHRIASIRNTA